MMSLISFFVGYMLLHTVFASIASDCLERHNFYRSKHGAPALKYRTELAKGAQKLASVLTVVKNETGEAVTRGVYDSNFFIATWSTARTIRVAVENWYNEGNSYNFSEPQTSTNNKRFVEMLWKSHERLGCGYAMTEEREGEVITAVVALYEPAAIRLDIDDYIDNILPTISRQQHDS